MTALEANLDEVNVNLLLASAAWFTLVWLFDGVWLSLRNYNVVRATTTPPPELGGQLSQETLDKARAYTLDKGALSLVHGTFGHAVHLAQLFCGFMPWLWAFSGSLAPGCTELTQSLVLLVVSTLIEVVIELPWDVYSTFVLEQKHGFNKQTAAFFAVDQLKKLALNIVLQVLIVGLLLQIILWAGDNFFLYAWALVAGFTMAMMAIFPVRGHTPLCLHGGVCVCVCVCVCVEEEERECVCACRLSAWRSTGVCGGGCLCRGGGRQREGWSFPPPRRIAQCRIHAVAWALQPRQPRPRRFCKCNLCAMCGACVRRTTSRRCSTPLCRSRRANFAGRSRTSRRR